MGTSRHSKGEIASLNSTYCGHELWIVPGPAVSSHEAATLAERVPCDLTTVHTEHWNKRLDFHWRTGEQGVYRRVPAGAVTMEDPEIQRFTYKDLYRSLRNIRSW